MVFCCDFSYLNAVTKKDAYSIPDKNESFSKLGRAKYFATLVLGPAYWQVPLRKLDRQKTTFAFELGVYQWKRLPFGLCDAVDTFQWLLDLANEEVRRHDNQLRRPRGDCTNSIRRSLRKFRRSFLLHGMPA